MSKYFSTLLFIFYFSSLLSPPKYNKITKTYTVYEDEKKLPISKTTSIPDPNFENYLETHDKDGNIVSLGSSEGLGDGIAENGLVFTERIEDLWSLDVSNYGIKSLEGIEAFKNLERLYCNNNLINELNINAPLKLQFIKAHNNDELINVDISDNSKIISVDLQNNKSLTSLKIKNDEILNRISSINLSNTPILTCIEVSNLEIAYNKLVTNLNKHQYFTLDCANQKFIYIPDNNFEKAIIEMGFDIGTPDNYIPYEIANRRMGASLDISSKEIESLEGIEEFHNVLSLNFSDNNLIEVDLSKNTKLKYIYGKDNKLKNISLPESNTLIELVIENNIIEELNLEKQQSLTFLNCSNNSLNSIVMPLESSIVRIDADNNNLEILDLKNEKNLRFLDCSNNNLKELNVTNSSLLINLFASENQIEEIDLSSNTNLMSVSLRNNKLKVVDLSNNLKIEGVNIDINNIEVLDLSKNINLKYFFARDNYFLKTLNLKNGNNRKISEIFIGNTPSLNCILVDDVYYSEYWWEKDLHHIFSTECNTTEYSMYIPDDNFEIYLETHDIEGNKVEIGNPFSMGDGISDNNIIYTNRIKDVINLNISDSNISDLTGISEFKKIEILNVSKNKLTNLNFEENINLKSLSANENQLSSLNIMENVNLLELYLFDNKLSTINIEKNTKLYYLSIGKNQLKNIDLSNNLDLFLLYIHENELSQIDLSKNTNLRYLALADNNLSDINIGSNLKLERLWIYNNPITAITLDKNPNLWLFSARNCDNLTKLNFSQNKNLGRVWLYDNENLESINLNNNNNANIEVLDIKNTPNLTCIQVDDVSYSTTNWTERDTHHTFSEDCYSTLNSTNYTFTDFKIYPNPTKNKITIQSNGQIDKSEIITVLGKSVMKNHKKEEIDISNLPKGVYFIKVYSENGVGIRKFIKE